MTMNATSVYSKREKWRKKERKTLVVIIIKRLIDRGDEVRLKRLREGIDNFYWLFGRSFFLES